MRLHHLSLTAFGPFAGTELVDFDELGEAGLFLLTGPTGAGKTTILDAVSFALYGTVPGVRGVKALRSQHAPADRRPEVVLDFSVRERRFVVRRSPEWSRPKRRGDGFTTENASATLLETTHGDEQLLSSRAQEVGHFIGELVGMASTQFVQVAMLPQGEFQKFLRASSQDRHDVLQHLFRSDRYARIEDWVHDHSRSLREQADAGQAAVVRALDALADRARCEVPEDLLGDAVHAPGVGARALSWADQVVEASSVAASSAREDHEAAVAVAAEVRARHDTASRVHQLIARRDQAAAALEALEADAQTETEAVDRLAADQRARQWLPLLDLRAEAARGADDARHDWARHSDGLHSLREDLQLPDRPTPAALTAAEQEMRTRSSRLEALLPRERDLRAAREQLVADQESLQLARAELAAAHERRAAIPAALSAAREQLATAQAGAERLEPLRLELEQARARQDAADRAEECEQTLRQLRDDERDARDRAADARERVQDLTARRLAGIAAELAGRLAPGDACQVCGSTEHPAPARPAPDAVTEHEQASATREHDVATAAHLTARGKVLQAEERLDALRAAADGLGSPEAAGLVAGLEEALATASRAAEAAEEAGVLVERLQAEHDELTSTVHERTTTVATLEQAVESGRRTAQTLEGDLADALGTAWAESSLTTEVERLTGLVTTLSDACGALTALHSAEGRHHELEERTRSTALEQGFRDVEDLQAAVLADPERERLTALLDSRRDAVARARAVLEDEAVRALDGEAAPDLTGLASALAEAEDAEAAVARARHSHEEAAEALTRHRARLESALATWAPVREEYLRADSMSKLVRGMGADNQLQMRLSAYVLATRLDQVVAAANERLAHMRDQRYLLQRTGRAARRGAQAGLGLEMVDQWTGDVRDPATLSGGETFVVSLALALGLADVVTQEAGGTEILTLFIDEGFGSLDPDTLDDVMDRLDDLRTGGRCVGVVSHVGELRNRIPTQLHVEKGRTGSVVVARTAVG